MTIQDNLAGSFTVLAKTSSEDLARDTGDRTFGLTRIGGVHLALPVRSIREVIGGPSAYSPMPIHAEGLLGAIDIRGTIIPVLDLRPTFALSPEARESHVVVVMLCQGHLIGLAADDVCGIAHMAETDLCALVAAGPASGATLASHTFQSNGTIFTVLDAKRVAELPGIPLAVERAAVQREGLSKTTESIVLFSCGASRFGVDAVSVDATVPMVKIQRGVLTMGYCLGTIDHHGHDVPVIDTCAAIGLPSTETRSAETTVIVIRFSEKAMLGFAIDTVRDIVRIAPADILAMPLLEGYGTSLFRGLLIDSGGGQSLILNVDQMRVHSELARLAGFRKPRIRLQPSSGASETVKDASGEGRLEPFLTYMTGEEQATLMGQVTEILTYPTGVAPFDLKGSATLGLFAHRGRVVPLACLATVLGQARAFEPDKARVLLVESMGKMAGFVVESLLSIETANSHFPGSSPSHDGDGLFRPLVMLGAGDQKRWVPHVDLIAEVENIYANDGAAPKVELAQTKSRKLPVPDKLPVSKKLRVAAL